MQGLQVAEQRLERIDQGLPCGERQALSPVPRAQATQDVTDVADRRLELRLRLSPALFDDRLGPSDHGPRRAGSHEQGAPERAEIGLCLEARDQTVESTVER